MDILIYGSGAVGIGIAAALFDAGMSPEFKTSSKTKEVIKKRGIKRIGIFNEVHVEPSKIVVWDNLSNIKEKKYDYILVCTKTICNKENAEDLGKNSSLLKENGKIILVHNGWGNDEPYLEYFNKNQIYSARVITGFTRPELHISEVTVHAAPMLIGSLYNEDIEPVRELSEAINNGGMPCEVTNEISKALWAKMIYNCTLNPLGAVLNVNYGKLTEVENSVFIMDRIIDEVFNVMKAARYESYWKSAEQYKKEFYSKLVPSTYEHRSSTLQDIEKKVKTEIDSLTGSIVRLGVKFNVDVPYNTMMLHLIKSMESNY